MTVTVKKMEGKREGAREGGREGEIRREIYGMWEVKGERLQRNRKIEGGGDGSEREGGVQTETKGGVW